MNIADVINKYMPQFDKTDAVYKAFISDPDGIANPMINTPKDYNKGGIANLLEWLYKYSLELKKQIYLNLAETNWIDYIAGNFIGINRYEGENDADYVNRIKQFLMDKKISPASIIYATIPFSSPGLPVLYEGESSGAYADISYAGCYIEFFNTAPGPDQNNWVLPAISIGQQGGLFNFVLILQNTDTADIYKVLDIVQRWKAGGITFQIIIETV